MVHVDVRADTEAGVQSNSSPVGGDPSMRAVNGKVTDTNNSQYFADVTPVHTKLSKCTE